MASLQSSRSLSCGKLLSLLVIFLIHFDLSHCLDRGHYWVNESAFSTPYRCRRQCTVGQKPLICYYKFHLEFYTTMGPACNRTGQESQCIMADGVEKGILPINRQFPGPEINVCKGDMVVVDVENEALGTEATIHWHGIHQNGYQYYDGVPYITQCPIPSSSTFRYQFLCNNAGTHFYHSHVMTYMLDGQQGDLIVRDPEDPHRYLYDFGREYVMHLSDWMHHLSAERFPGYYTNRQTAGQKAANILINGRGRWTDRETNQTTPVLWELFYVEEGKRYRFRIVNSFSTVCPAEVAFHNHKCTVIAVDGTNVKPKEVDKVVILTGERMDCIINMNQKKDAYWIQVRGLGECGTRGVQQLGLLYYVGGSSMTPLRPEPAYNDMPTGVTYNGLDATRCNTRDTSSVVCVNQLESVENVDPKIMKVEPDERHVLDFWTYSYTRTDNKQLFSNSNAFPLYFSTAVGTQLISLFNDISFESPASTLLSDRRSYKTICKDNVRSTCTEPCSCTQVISIPLGRTVELVLYDRFPVPGVHHPIHLHGYEFKVMTIGNLTGREITRQDMDKVIQEHTERLRRGDYKNPPSKDTLKIPQGGYAIVRFWTNNPGWWLMHCHFTWHHLTGMELVVRVGEDIDLPQEPPGFPQCSNWKPAVELLNDFYAVSPH
nr:laccase-1-like [Megalopta genalis]